MSKRNVILWTSVISNYVKSNKEIEAIGSFKSMLSHGERPNHVTFLTVLRAVGLTGFEGLTQEVHGVLIKMGFDSEVSVTTTLMSIYSLHGMSNVIQLFNQTPAKDLILWSAMITACTRNGHFKQAFENFRAMQSFGIVPNNVSLIGVLPACTNLGGLLAGKEIHAFSIKIGFYSDINLQNHLVHFYAKCRDLHTSILVFDRISAKDIISWNTIIRGCLENGIPTKALSMFTKMWSSDVKPNESTVQTVLSACSHFNELSFGLWLHCYIVKSGFLASISVGTALLNLYAAFGAVETSRVLFDSLHHKDLVAWSAMISAYAQVGQSNLALETFKRMQLASEKPNEITLVSLLRACSTKAAQEHGQSIHAYVIINGYSSNVFITSALIDFYCKFGRLAQGRTVFDLSETSDLVCWSSMINGYGVNGCGREALEVFHNMLQQGLNPNDVVFISVLSACSHCGLVDEGWKWFNSMRLKYGVAPTLCHYTCMVDLLSRRGLMEEALTFVNGMPVEPDESTWGALLAGCRMGNDDTKVMELATKQLIRLDPNNTSYYVILSNLYAQGSRWEEVERLRKWVKEKRLTKTVGYSTIEASSSNRYLLQ